MLGKWDAFVNANQNRRVGDSVNNCDGGITVALADAIIIDTLALLFPTSYSFSRTTFTTYTHPTRIRDLQIYNRRTDTPKSSAHRLV